VFIDPADGNGGSTIGGGVIIEARDLENSDQNVGEASAVSEPASGRLLFADLAALSGASRAGRRRGS
jgi:hypothetical protein